jgi:type III secretion protein Q
MNAVPIAAAMPDTATISSPALYAAVLPAGSPQAAGATALAPAAVSAQYARLAWAVRRGRVARLAGMPAVLSLEPAGDAPGADWRGALLLAPGHGADLAGRIELADGARLLQGLTGIDPGAAPTLEAQPWLAAALAGRLAGTPFAGFGLAGATHAGPAEDEETCCLRLTLRTRRHLVTTLARAPVAAWLAFLSHGDWSHRRMPARPWLSAGCETMATLAHHTLPAGALRALAPGDVIVPASPRFSPGGHGWIRLGSRTFQVRYAAANSLEILDVEQTMNTDEITEEAGYATARAALEAEADAETGAATEAGDEAYAVQDAESTDHDAGALFAELDAALPDDAPPHSDEDAPDGLDALPVTLSFELGRLALPLADVRTLGPGAVVRLDGGSPASVAIASAGQTVGRGEIVDVAGRLGVRITHWGSPC